MNTSNKKNSEKVKAEPFTINGEIIASSEGYSSEASCRNGIASVKKNAPIAEIVEVEK